MILKIESNDKKAIAKLSRNRKETWDAIQASFVIISDFLMKSITNSITNEPKTGRIYLIKSKTGNVRTHQASAPGEAPANLTGNLVRSLKAKPLKTQLTIGATADYAYDLEMNMNRPFIKRAINKNRNRIAHTFYEELYKELSAE